MKVKSIANFVLKGVKKSTIVDDDSLSVSSTHTVDRSSKTSAQHCPLVGFDLAENVVHELDHVDHEEISNRWYSEQEYLQMKEANNFTTKTVRGSDEYVGALSRAYDACCEGSQDTINEAELQQQLQLWSARTGLEQRVVKSACKGKQLRRMYLVELAYNLAQDCPQLSQEELQELLREKCEELSKPARLFAMHIGRAQAQA